MRRLWLDTNGLLASPSEPLDVVGIIKKLGFVQIDSIQNVSRAHHHILWSRNTKYREHMLDELLGAREHLFEHFTHDASVLPMEMYPMWRRRFGRMKAQIERSSYHNPEIVTEWADTLLKRIEEEGPLSTKDFESKPKSKDEVWSRPPHKRVLDHLWYSGILATSHREKFQKFYDLAERVIPEEHYQAEHSDEAQIDWLCREALSRLAVGNPKQIKDFWDAKDVAEVNSWVERSNGSVTPVRWQSRDGTWANSYALKDIEERINLLPTNSSRMRIINPFDPAIRDRDRLQAIFGFEYKIEIFVPAAKRRWGYYVYPVLEGDKFVGRVDAKGDRKAKTLNIINFWPEDGIKWGSKRQEKLEAELKRFAHLAGLGKIVWQ